VHVLSEKGAVGLTIKAIADWLRVTPGRVSQMTTRHHLVLVVAARFAKDGARAALARLLEHLGPAPAESA
jgi:hypothetical protein